MLVAIHDEHGNVVVSQRCNVEFTGGSVKKGFVRLHGGPPGPKGKENAIATARCEFELLFGGKVVALTEDILFDLLPDDIILYASVWDNVGNYISQIRLTHGDDRPNPDGQWILRKGSAAIC